MNRIGGIGDGDVTVNGCGMGYGQHMPYGNGTQHPWSSDLLVAIGSAMIWAWGYLIFLSPVLYLGGGAVFSNVEGAYLVAQAVTCLLALMLFMWLKRWPVSVPPSTLLLCGIAASISTGVLAVSNQGDVALGWICGIVDASTILLIVAAWGARYILASRHIMVIVTVSFVISYLLYFGVQLLAFRVAVMLVVAFPTLSVLLWLIDAHTRHTMTSAVFPARGVGEDKFPGEVTAGVFDPSILPWRTLGIVVIAALLGNMLSVIIVNFDDGIGSAVFTGGFICSGCLCVMLLALLLDRRREIQIESVGRIMLPLAVLGLLFILVFNRSGMGISASLVMGSALFLQTLVILEITESTRENGMSPLFSFAIGQGLISFVIFFGNIMGRLAALFVGTDMFYLEIICAVGVFVLSVIPVLRGSERHPSPVPMNPADMMAREAREDPPLGSAYRNRVEELARTANLTPKESEVLGYLGRGRSMSYTADKLYVTTGTVKSHTTHIYRKLGVNSRQELLDLLER